MGILSMQFLGSGSTVIRSLWVPHPSIGPGTPPWTVWGLMGLLFCAHSWASLRFQQRDFFLSQLWIRKLESEWQKMVEEKDYNLLETNCARLTDAQFSQHLRRNFYFWRYKALNLHVLLLSAETRELHCFWCDTII